MKRTLSSLAASVILMLLVVGQSSFAGEPFVRIQRQDAERTNMVHEPLFSGTPKLKWRWQSETPITSALFAAEGRLFLGHGSRLDNVHVDGHLAELDISSGKLLSDRQTFSTILFSPFSAYDRLFIIGSRSFETFISSDAGKEYAQLYEFKPSDAEFFKGPLLINCSVPPLVSLGHMIVNEGPEIRAIDLSTFEEVWRIDSPAAWQRAWLSVLPLASASDNLLVVGSASKGLMAVDLTSRKKVWQADLDVAIQPEICASGSRLFAATVEGTLLSLDMRTGKKRFDVRPTSPVLVPPSVAGDYLYVGLEGAKLAAISAVDGNELWVADLPGDLMDSPLVGKDWLLLGTRSGYVLCLSANNGSEIWRYRAFGAVVTTPTLYDGAVLFADDKSVVYCIEENKPAE
ncbi:MAG: hypothetical protein Kow00107_00640 [Planctomycetota bacterium]